MPEENKFRTSVLLSQYHRGVLERMGEVWGDVKNNQSEAIRKAIEQTDYKMRGPGRSEYSLVAVEILQRMAEHMGIEVNDLLSKLIDTSVSAARDNGCDCIVEFDDEGMSIDE